MFKNGEKMFDKLIPGSDITYQEKLQQLANQKLSGIQISKALGINYTTVHRWLRKLNINLPNYHNALKFNNKIFDIVDTEEKAYWLGFLYADGYVSKNGKTVALDLMGSDIEHLDKFRRFLDYETEIKISDSKCNGNVYPRCRLTMTNSHFNRALINLGCIPNKSLILSFPKTSIFSSEQLIRHFIRGYVDGDGCVTHTSNSKLEFIIIGTKEFLNGIKEYCPYIHNILYHKDKRRPDSNTYSLIFANNIAKAFGRYIYENATIFLSRKYNKFLDLINE